jgi:tRNA (guanine10-N2)-methyltransferase
VRLDSEDAARKLISRCILAKAIYEVWGSGSDYEDLHDNVKSHSQHLWPLYKKSTFKFSVDSFQGTRSTTEQRKMIERFHYLGFEGPIRMKGAEQEFCILEEFQFNAAKLGVHLPQAVHMGRFIESSDRDVVNKYDLKKRKYISTTSMDSELALVTANISHAASGKLFYDPFVGTGSFPIACAHFGAQVWGSDIDGRSIRGKGKTNIVSNFVQYDLLSRLGDNFISDLTNTPLRAARLFDGIVCDPPYGVREGLKVLGSKDPTKPKEPVYKDGEASHL